MTLMGIIAGVLVLAAVAILVLVWKMIVICPPNEVLVFSGTHRVVNGKQVGYRLVQGGRGLRIPLLEVVDRLDLTNMAIEIRVVGAYCKGGIPLNVDGVANVKIASSEPYIANAIERLLNRSRQEIMAVARETLEGNLRGVLATLTPEEVNQDREKFADSLLEEADQDLSRLGLELDTLKIQNVSDDKGYLDSLGRKQTAALLMRSRVAEAENEALSAERNASNQETQEIAKLEAHIATDRAEAERRIIDAQTRKEALVAEARGEVSALVAKYRAEVDVQHARLEQVRLRLEADHVKPAEAQRQQMVESARGDSAAIIERGKATAEALRRVAETWAGAGESARQIFVAQKMGSLVAHLMATVGEIPVDKVTFIDRELAGGGGGGGGNFAVNAALTSEQLKHTLGVDLPALLNQLGGQMGGRMGGQAGGARAGASGVSGGAAAGAPAGNAPGRPAARPPAQPAR